MHICEPNPSIECKKMVCGELFEVSLGRGAKVKWETYTINASFVEPPCRVLLQRHDNLKHRSI